MNSEINLTVDRTEDGSDDSDYEMHGQALPVAEFDVNIVDENTIPLTSQEYLQQVIAQRARLPGIVTATVPKLKPENSQKLNSYLFLDDEILPSKHRPSKEWQNEQVSNFSSLRYRIECNKERWIERYSERLPIKKNDWFTFLFQNNPPEKQARLPYLNIVLSMHNEMLENVIKFIIEWVDEDKLPIYQAGIWLFALLACIEVPVCIKLMKKLRTFVLKCREIRQEMDFSNQKNRTELIAQNLFICLIGKYFGQHDLSD